MTTIIQGRELRDIALGRYLQGKTSDITTDADGTFQIFTVAGGEVLITAMWGLVTTAITVANTINVQTDPTTGDTTVIAAATDLGTTDTAAGTTIGFVDGDTATPDLAKGFGPLRNILATTGEVESVVTGTNPDGVIEWYCTWIPLTDGATVVAAA